MINYEATTINERRRNRTSKQRLFIPQINLNKCIKKYLWIGSSQISQPKLTSACLNKLL